MRACLSSQSLQCQTLVTAKEEQIRVLNEQLDSARATAELQVRALRSQATYIRSLKDDLERSRVSAWPSPAGLDAELLLGPSSPDSIFELDAFSTDQGFDQSSRRGLDRSVYGDPDQHPAEGLDQHSCPRRAQDEDHQDGLAQDPFDGLAPLLALAETAAIVNHTAAGDDTTPQSAESSLKRKAEDIAGVVKKARPA
ncbi:hypothetical protein LY78DRAFT_680650 [Colletotrichum sublineola]|nr:hypothetical protein LY78DRAFT_680650 [Colletotrichum sublineola]